MPRRSRAELAIVSHSETVTHLVPPSDLSDAEKLVFRDAVLSCKPGHFQQSDTHLLAAYSRAVALEKQASERLQIDGYVTEDNRPSPWLSVLTQSSKSLLSLARLLRLAPLSRSQANPTRTGPPMSYYEREEATREAE